MIRTPWAYGGPRFATELMADYQLQIVMRPANLVFQDFGEPGKLERHVRALRKCGWKQSAYSAHSTHWISTKFGMAMA